MAGDAAPTGDIRVAVTSVAEPFLSGPLIAYFAAAHPGVTLDVAVTDDEFDIVAAGFGADVRLGEVIEQDMVAVPISGQERELVAAAPCYLARHGTPQHPRELLRHRCIGWLPAPYRCEFVEDDAPFNIAVHP